MNAPNRYKRSFFVQVDVFPVECVQGPKELRFAIPARLLAFKFMILVILLFSTGVMGQGEYQRNVTSRPGDDILPPSPEAVALNKYVAIPVGLYTGTPQIDIPFWEIKEGDITIPVSLSYHAS